MALVGVPEVRKAWLYGRSQVGHHVLPTRGVHFVEDLPEHQPDGAIMAADLVSPESQLITPPYTFSFLNGISSLIRWGLGPCLGPDMAPGFGTCLGDCFQTRNCQQWKGNRRRRSPRAFPLCTA